MATVSVDHPRTAKRLSSWYTIGIPLIVSAVMLPVFGVAATIFALWLVHLWDIPFWAVCVVAALGSVVGTYLVWRLMRSLARRRFQISLRMMFIGMAVCSVLFGTFWNRIDRMRREQAALMHLALNGGYLVSYGDYNWLRKQYGVDPFATIDGLAVQNNLAISEILEHPDEFADLEAIDLWSVGDTALQRIGEMNRFPKFKGVGCYKVTITDAGLEELAKCTKLNWLFINGASKITDNGLSHLTKLRDLEHLDLFSEGWPLPITNAGLKHIGELTWLRTLSFRNLPITDVGLEHLQNLTKLEELEVDSKTVTDGGLVRLSKALPDCWIRANEKEIAEQFQEVVVWQVPNQAKPIKRITDPAQISTLIEYQNREMNRQGIVWNGLRKHEPTAPLLIEFRGRGRCFYRIAIGNGLYFWQYRKQWNSRSFSTAEERQLCEILGIDPTQYLAKAD